jgi:hypothetical protein
MTNLANDPPPSLAEAEVSFERFLASQGYSSRVHWVHDTDLVVDNERRWSVRRNTVFQKADFAQRYLEGVAKGLGVEIAARCASQDQTFATIFIPKDAIDAQYHMLGGGLKMSCPASLISGSLV